MYYLETEILGGLPVAIEFELNQDGAIDEFEIVKVNGNLASAGLQNKLIDKLRIKDEYEAVIKECEYHYQDSKFYA